MILIRKSENQFKLNLLTEVALDVSCSLPGCSLNEAEAQNLSAFCQQNSSSLVGKGKIAPCPLSRPGSNHVLETKLLFKMKICKEENKYNIHLSSMVNPQPLMVSKQNSILHTEHTLSVRQPASVSVEVPSVGFGRFSFLWLFPSLLSASFAVVVMPREAAIKGKERNREEEKAEGARNLRTRRGTKSQCDTKSIIFLKIWI